MNVINFTTKEVTGAAKQMLVFDPSIVSNLHIHLGKGANKAASTVFRQIEAHIKRDSVIVLDLPIWLTVEVEMLLAQYDLVNEVFYFIDDVMFPSPLFANYKSLIAEKAILLKICNEQHDLTKTA